MKRIKKTIKKYWAIFAIGIKEAINYRAELLLWSTIDAMPLVAMVVIWLSAFENGGTIAGYTQSLLIAYYIAGYVFQDLTGSHFEEDMLKQIQSGRIATHLVKPLSLKRHLVTNELSWRFMSALVAVMPVIVLVTLFTNIMPPVHTIHLLILPILLFAYLMESIYSLMVLSMGFVFEQAKSLMHLKWMLGWLFSGSMIPFEFMPQWLSQIAELLPFKFRYYLPVQIYFGNIQGISILYQFGLEIIWFLVLLFFMRLLWNKNLKKFTAVGN